MRIGRLAFVGVVVLGLAGLAAMPFAMAAQPATSPGVGEVVGLKLTDVAGAVHSLGDSRGCGGMVFVVANTECPISNKLMPQLNRLAKAAGAGKVEFYGVLSDPTVTRADGAKWIKDFSVGFPVLFDASAVLAERLQPTVTPEAYVFTSKGELVYKGRVDDSYASPTIEKGVTAHHDLEDAITRLIKAGPGGKVDLVTTEPVGCVFEAWKHAANAPAKVTYNRDIAPLLNANCVECHRAGEVAPFALSSYQDAGKRAQMLADVTKDKVMPPWKPAEGFGDFHDERRLSAEEITLIAAWAKAELPEGDAADLPAVPEFGTKDGWSLGKPNMVVKMPKAFNVPADSKDIVRWFVVPMDVKEDRQVIGMEYHPGNRKVVHHMLAFLDNTGAARQLAREKGDGTSYLSAGPGFVPSGGLGGWVPGSMPRMLPEGVGQSLPAGSDLVLQIHYHPDGKDETDQGELGLYFAKKPVEHIAANFLLVNRQIDIKAGDAHYERTATVTTPVDVTLIGITPHMHNVGRSMKVTATLPDGKVLPLIWVQDWDWNWQGTYQLREPLKLPKGSRVDMVAEYDNSEANPHNPNNPPKEIRRGEQTTDEMCLCFLQIYRDAAAPAAGGGLLRRLLGGL